MGPTQTGAAHFWQQTCLCILYPPLSLCHHGTYLSDALCSGTTSRTFAALVVEPVENLRSIFDIADPIGKGVVPGQLGGTYIYHQARYLRDSNVDG